VIARHVEWTHHLQDLGGQGGSQYQT
jgi:hypothetical protein